MKKALEIEKLRHRLMYLLTLALGIYLVSWPWKDWPIVKGLPVFPTPIQHALPKLGDALIIAIIVGGVFEVAAKERLLREFAREVSHHMVGYNLPPELRDAVYSHLRAELVRTAWQITYDITRTEEDGVVRCNTSFSYEMENRSTRKITYKAQYSIDKPHGQVKRNPEINNFQAICDGCPAPSAKEEDGFLIQAMNVELPPYPHQPFKFVAQSTEYFPHEYEANLITAHPVLRTSVTVTYPKDEFGVDLNLSVDADSPRRVPLNNGVLFEISTPLLPGQAILVKWWPTSKAG